MARESAAVEAEAEPAADETIDPPIVRRLVVAAECRAPLTRGARSIFDLADAQARGLRVGSLPRCADDDPARGPVVALRARADHRVGLAAVLHPVLAVQALERLADLKVLEADVAAHKAVPDREDLDGVGLVAVLRSAEVVAVQR